MFVGPLKNYAARIARRFEKTRNDANKTIGRTICNAAYGQASSYSTVVLADKPKYNHEDDYEFELTCKNPPGEIGNSPFWRRKMRTFHGLLDVDKDGVISFDDFKLLANRFVELGHLSEKHQTEFHNLIQNIWMKQWGCIDPYNLVTTEQYLEDMKNVINDPERRKKVHHFLPYIFKAVDNDKNGVISLPEFHLFFKCVNLSDEDAVSSFFSIDTNNDGQIQFKEFVTLGRQFFISDDENDASKLFWGPLVA